MKYAMQRKCTTDLEMGNGDGKWESKFENESSMDAELQDHTIAMPDATI
jgi:hypothetical protein